MDPLIQKDLENPELTDFHSTLLDHCKGLVQRGRSSMSSYYATWDAAHEAYVNYRQPDADDAKAENRKEPTKSVIPLSRSQVLSFVVLNMAIYLQRPRFFEIDGVGPEDADSAKVAEALLENDLRHNRHVSLLWQWLLDIGRFGLGVFKAAYTTKMCKKLVRQSSEALTFMGNELAASTEQLVMGDALEFQGNELRVISPYNFFPDPTCPLRDFQAGEFCASEQWFNEPTLRELEAQGVIAGLDHVEPFDANLEGNQRRMPNQPSVLERGLHHTVAQSTGIYNIIEVQCKLIPSKFFIDGKPMGPEKTSVIWNIWIANDNRLIKAEPLGYMHNQFTYTVAELHPDTRDLCNEGLVGSIAQLQAVISWLVNSHITNVRKVIGDKLVAKTSLLEMEDLKERRSVIRVKEEANDIPLGDIIQQLKVTDVTTNHIADASFLMDLAQITTGVTDNAQGIFHTGRRSAREASNVAQAIAARLRMPALQMHCTGLEPLGKQMITNHQQGLTHEFFVRAVGAEADPGGYVKFIKASREQLVGSYDFAILDATTPSERTALAAALGAFLVKIPGGFQTIIAMGYDPRKFVQEWLILQGIKFPERFLLDPVRAQQLVQQTLVAQQLYAGPNPNNPGGGQPGLSGTEGNPTSGGPPGGPESGSIPAY